MIKVNGPEVQWEGTPLELVTELAALLHELVKKEPLITKAALHAVTTVTEMNGE